MGLVTRWTDCYTTASSLSAETLTRHPLIKDVQLARNMEFWKCALTAKTECCAEAQLNAWGAEMQGEDMEETVDWTQYDLPTDRYERAAVTAMVYSETVSPVEKFVCDILSSDGTDF